MIERSKTRVYPGANGPRPDGYEVRKAEGEKRNEAWQRLSPKQQLRELDRRLGEGVGAKKQRAKIRERMNRRPVPIVDEPEPNHRDPDRSEPRKLKAKDRRRKERRQAQASK